MTPLNADNYRQGFLVDEELMAGVTQHPENPGVYVAFVLQHTTGEYLGYQSFSTFREVRLITHSTAISTALSSW